jgi:hypothetical protein
VSSKNHTPLGRHPKTGQFIGSGSMGDSSVQERPTGLKAGETVSSTQANVNAQKPNGGK